MKKVTTAMVKFLRPVTFEEYVHIYLTKKNGTVVHKENWEYAIPATLDEILEEGHKYFVTVKDIRTDRINRKVVGTIVINEK